MKACFFRKDSDAGKIAGSRKRGNTKTGEATGVSLQELSGADGGGTLWTSLIRRVAGSQTQFKGT